MKAGNHKVKIIGCFLGLSKEKKTKYFGIEFENDEGKTIENLFYLTEATQDRNMDKLLELGYQSKDIVDMANPKLSIDDLFDQPDGIELVIEDEFYQGNDDTIRSRPIVKWVNVGFSGHDKLDLGGAVNAFSGSAFNGILMQKRSGKKTVKKEVAKKPEVQIEEIITDDHPF